MDVTKIPFVEKVGIVRQPDGGLGLPFNESVHNHLQTIHASAQFTLAETASGEVLQVLFPEIVG
jgi:acyl-coenzyme A thioesterase PaaI-like protein